MNRFKLIILVMLSAMTFLLLGCERQQPPPSRGMYCHRTGFGEVMCSRA